MKAKWRWSPAHPRASAPRSPSAWPRKALRSPSTTAPARRQPIAWWPAITGKGGKAVAVHGNLTDGNDAKTVVAETVKAFGAIDILVNNAGIYEFSPLDGITPEHFHKHFDLNVLGLLLGVAGSRAAFQ